MSRWRKAHVGDPGGSIKPHRSRDTQLSTTARTLTRPQHVPAKHATKHPHKCSPCSSIHALPNQQHNAYICRNKLAQHHTQHTEMTKKHARITQRKEISIEAHARAAARLMQTRDQVTHDA